MRRLVFVMLLASCSAASVALTPDGERVEVGKSEDECSFVALVNCEVGGNGKSFEHNSNQCLNELRNKAAVQGATHVQLGAVDRDENQVTASAVLTGTPGGCRNCVSMTAQSFRCEAREECLQIQDDYTECLQRGGYDPTVK